MLLRRQYQLTDGQPHRQIQLIGRRLGSAPECCGVWGHRRARRREPAPVQQYLVVAPSRQAEKISAVRAPSAGEKRFCRVWLAADRRPWPVGSLRIRIAGSPAFGASRPAGPSALRGHGPPAAGRRWYPAGCVRRPIGLAPPGWRSAWLRRNGRAGAEEWPDPAAPPAADAPPTGGSTSVPAPERFGRSEGGAAAAAADRPPARQADPQRWNGRLGPVPAAPAAELIVMSHGFGGGCGGIGAASGPLSLRQ